MVYLSFALSAFKVLLLKIKNGTRLRMKWMQQLSPSLRVKVKKGAKLCIDRGLQCRRYCTLLCNAGQMTVGRGVFMNQNVMVTCQQEIVIGDRVTIANNVVIVDHDHDYKHTGDSSFVTDKVVIGEGVWIGANAVILKGCHIGANSVVAAGTVVRKGVYPPYSLLYGGNPLTVKEIKHN